MRVSSYLRFFISSFFFFFSFVGIGCILLRMKVLVVSAFSSVVCEELLGSHHMFRLFPMSR